MICLLAGGTGGAKLARGIADAAGAAELTVIANTGDDVEIYGAHVSPDPDLVTYWLADRIDERGWGLAGDTFAVMDGLRELGRTLLDEPHSCFRKGLDPDVVHLRLLVSRLERLVHPGADRGELGRRRAHDH